MESPKLLDPVTATYLAPKPQQIPLPPELLVQTLGCLTSAQDKQNARLVCKAFAAAALPSLASTAIFSHRRPFIDSIQQIARHPVVSKYITHIACHGTPSVALYSYTLPARHEDFVRRPETDEAINSGRDEAVFGHVLKKFVNLNRFSFTDISENSHHCEDKIMVYPTWPKVTLNGDLWGLFSPYHNFAAAVRKLSKSGFKPRELVIGGPKCGMSHEVFSCASPSDQQHLLNVFANLRKVDITVNTHHGTDSLAFSGLGPYIAHAKGLDTLRIVSFPEKWKAEISSVFVTSTWQHLRSLSLVQFTMCPTIALVNFFDRHRATLEHLELTHVCLTRFQNEEPYELWAHLFDELRRRSITFKELNLALQWTWGWYTDYSTGDGGRVLKYLREGGINPLSCHNYYLDVVQNLNA
ncbi:hypothetical protein MMC28_005980 [Mycoblastus sanguinarius]|nr:hypothetical protein [Mycoblastus sanguinarius]